MALPDASGLFSFGIGNDTNMVYDVSDGASMIVPDRCGEMMMYKYPMYFQLRSDTSLHWTQSPKSDCHGFS